MARATPPWALGLLLLLGSAPRPAAAAPQDARTVVVARATEQRGGTFVPCGVIYAVGWVVYELVDVVEGPSPGTRFVAVHGCPADRALVGEMRLVLRAKKPPGQPALSGKAPPADLPRFYAYEARPEAPAVTRNAGRLLGRPLAEVEGRHRRTGSDGDWLVLGPHLAVKPVGGRVAALRARVAPAMTCVEAAAWIGYPAGKGRGFPLRRRASCEWPGVSEKHRLAAGVAGRLEGAWFDLWVKDAR
jgi:hypothetical protein